MSGSLIPISIQSSEIIVRKEGVYSIPGFTYNGVRYRIHVRLVLPSASNPEELSQVRLDVNKLRADLPERVQGLCMAILRSGGVAASSLNGVVLYSSPTHSVFQMGGQEEVQAGEARMAKITVPKTVGGELEPAREALERLRQEFIGAGNFPQSSTMVATAIPAPSFAAPTLPTPAAVKTQLTCLLGGLYAAFNRIRGPHGESWTELCKNTGALSEHDQTAQALRLIPGLEQLEKESEERKIAEGMLQWLVTVCQEGKKFLSRVPRESGVFDLAKKILSSMFSTPPSPTAGDVNPLERSAFYLITPMRNEYFSEDLGVAMNMKKDFIELIKKHSSNS